MAESTSTTASPSTQRVARDNIAEAIAQRAREAPIKDDDETRFRLERDSRQEFRRLIDPGIVRGLSDASAEATLKMLSTIAENLLKDFDNEKFRRFKPTNSLIKKNLVEVKGAIEYAVAMGFRTQVIEYQPFYVFYDSEKTRTNLRIGASVLQETLDRIAQKAEAAKLNWVDPKAIQKEIAHKVKLNYEEDRRKKKERDEMERQAREAKAAAAAKRAAEGPPAVATPPTHLAEDNSALFSLMPTNSIHLRGGNSSEPPTYAESLNRDSSEED